MKTPNKNWTFYMQSPQVGCMCRGHHNVGSLTVTITRVTFSQNHKLFPCDKNSKPWMRAHILTSRCHAKQWRLLKVLRSGVCSHVIMGLSHTPRHGPKLFFRRRLSCWDARSRLHILGLPDSSGRAGWVRWGEVRWSVSDVSLAPHTYGEHTHSSVSSIH